MKSVCFVCDSSPLPGDRRSQRGDEVIEMFARVQLGDGDEEVVVMAVVELSQRNPAEDLLVFEIGEDLRGRERRPHHELVVDRTG